jgi:uncharacterized protein
MTSPGAPRPILLASTWDPGLLPPLEMDGYLTGILVTPNLETRQWLAGMWRDIPAINDDDRLRHALADVLTCRKAIEDGLQQGWPAFRPAFCEAGKKADHARVREWVRGFSRAMNLEPQYWIDLADDERTATFLALLVGFMETGEPFDERDDADQIRDEHAALLPRALVGMRMLALMHEGNRAALQAVKATKTGRNQPCPCGSGKKFKRCCAAA